MSKKTVLVAAALAGFLLTTAGTLMATNMAFKLDYSLKAAGGGSRTGRQLLALPYIPRRGMRTAFDLILDIGNGNVNSVTSVTKYNKLNDTQIVYNGRHAGSPFLLLAGEGYLVQMASNVNYIIVGAHDPSIVVSLTGPAGVGGAGSGRQLFAPPYNVIARSAFELMTDIGNGSVAPVVAVSRYNTVNDTMILYTGRMGAGTPFPIVPGEAYMIQMAQNVPYVASHY